MRIPQHVIIPFPPKTKLVPTHSPPFSLGLRTLSLMDRDANTLEYQYHKMCSRVQHSRMELLLYIKALTTATRPFNVGIVKDKFCSQICLNEIHLCSQQRQLCLGIYEHLDTCATTKRDVGQLNASSEILPNVMTCIVQCCYLGQSSYKYKL